MTIWGGKPPLGPGNDIWGQMEMLRGGLGFDCLNTRIRIPYVYMIAIQVVSRAGALGLLVLILSTGCTKSNTPNGSTGAAAPSNLAQAMIGTWVHVGTPGQVREAPTEGGRFKYRTGTHWVVIGVEPDTGLVTENFGGTYTMNEDEYVETQNYADETWLRDNGKSFKFRVKIEGDMMTQIGVGNGYNEVWKRVRNDAVTNQPTDRN